MNNEIKEILDNLKYVSNDIKVHIKDGYIIREEIPSSMPKELRLDSYSAKVLLDYITNLQQNYDNNINKYEELIEKYSNLQQRIDKAIELIEPFIEWGECTINGKILKQISDIIKGDNND